MPTLASQIFNAQKRIKELEKEKEIVKNRLTLLQQNYNGKTIDERTSAQKKEIGVTQRELEILKKEIRAQDHLLRIAEKNVKILLREGKGNILDLDPGNMILVSQLRDLAKEYKEFASDFTRVNSMRLMASQFVEKIELIIEKNT